MSGNTPYYNPYNSGDPGVVLHNTIMERTDLSPSAKIVFAVLVRHAGRNGKCFPTNETIARQVGIKIRQVQNVLAELRKAKLIHKRSIGGRRHFFFPQPASSSMQDNAGDGCNILHEESANSCVEEANDLAPRRHQSKTKRKQHTTGTCNSYAENSGGGHFLTSGKDIEINEQSKRISIARSRDDISDSVEIETDEKAQRYIDAAVFQRATTNPVAYRKVLLDKARCGELNMDDYDTIVESLANPITPQGIDVQDIWERLPVHSRRHFVEILKANRHPVPADNVDVSKHSYLTTLIRNAYYKGDLDEALNHNFNN